MLYQTHLPLIFQFHPLASTTTSSSLPSVPLFSRLPLPQAETEMECVEAALKSSFRKDMAMKFSPQTFLEELSAFNVQNVTSCSDDFFVDDLLDFSHEEALLEEEEEEPAPQQQNHGTASVSPQHENPNQSLEISNPSNDHFGSLPTTELSVPDDDAADLEWLSHFVEDSFSEHSVSFPTGTLTGNLAEKAPEPESSVPAPLCFKTPVPAKARSKRSRTGVRVWPLGFGSPAFTESSSTSSSTTTSSSTSSSPSSPLLVYTAVTQNVEQVLAAPEKKAKRRAAPNGEGWGGAAQTPRRCSHCGVQKTPQWRTGPLGAKTLCNACGVRYKSGRLLPEYRPACSPTFSSELHSNHHRKVLEMRRKKEVTVGPETGSAPSPVGSGF